MLLPDVNVLIYAHFENIVAEQAEYARWLTRLATGSEPFALSVLVLTGFVRIATNPRIFDPPSTLENAFAFVSSLVERPTARIAGPDPDHLEIFERLRREAVAPRSGCHGEAGCRCSTRGDRGGARLHLGFHRLRLQPVRRGPVAPPVAPRQQAGPEHKVGTTDR